LESGGNPATKEKAETGLGYVALNFNVIKKVFVNADYPFE
jgi:hypothetical protein